MRKPDINDLLTACEEGNIEAAKKILDSGVDVNSVALVRSGFSERYNTTVLNYACHFNLYEMAKLFLERGADVNAKDADGSFPLSNVMENIQRGEAGSLEFLHILCSYSPDLEIKCADNATVLHKAFYFYDDKEVVEYLLDKGANINAIGLENTTLLMHMVKENRYDSVRYLVEHGADTNLTVNGLTALTEAVNLNRMNMVKYLIKNGADVHAGERNGFNILFNAAASGSVKMLKLCMEHSGIPLNTVNVENSSLLSIAARDDQSAMAEYLVDNGLDINHLDGDGHTPLDIAIIHDALHVSNYLLKNGAECDASLFSYHKRQDFHLMAAFKANDLETIEALLKSGANPGEFNNYGETLMHQAVSKNNIPVVDILLSNNADIKKDFFQRETPLHLAVRKNNIELVKRLVEHGGNIDEPNKKGKTPRGLAKSGSEIKKYFDAISENELLEKSIHDDCLQDDRFTF